MPPTSAAAELRLALTRISACYELLKEVRGKA